MRRFCKGHKRKLDAPGGGVGDDNDLPGLAHLKKAASVFKWKKERKK